MSGGEWPSAECSFLGMAEDGGMTCVLFQGL